MIISRIISRLQSTKMQGDIPWDAGRASVAMIFRPDNHLCMIRRAIKETDYWSGHMAFPGGREERQDETLQHTAVRETQEEIGILLREDQLLGRVSDIQHPRLAVSAFVYLIEDEPQLQLDPAEVAASYWLPFAAFLDPAHRGIKTTRHQGNPLEMPIVQIGEADVWGISLFFIDDLIRKCELSSVS